MSQKKRTGYLLVVLFLVLCAWYIYTKQFASRRAVIVITEFRLDKIIHLLGGAFIAGAAFFFLNKNQLKIIFLFVFLGALVWEAGEVFFDPEVRAFFLKTRDLWILDMLGDTLAGFLGAWVWWRYSGSGHL